MTPKCKRRQARQKLAQRVSAGRALFFGEGSQSLIPLRSRQSFLRQLAIFKGDLGFALSLIPMCASVILPHAFQSFAGEVAVCRNLRFFLWA